MSKDEKGDSFEVLQAFPKSIRVDLGGDLRRLQIGAVPMDSKPIKTDSRSRRSRALSTRSEQSVPDNVCDSKGH